MSVNNTFRCKLTIFFDEETENSKLCKKSSVNTHVHHQSPAARSGLVMCRCLCFVRQKLAVRSCPVGTAAKPLALIKPPSQSIAISVVPAKTPVSMVTAHINGQKTLSSETLQTSPINLQTPVGQNISRSQVQHYTNLPLADTPQNTSQENEILNITYV